MNQPVGNRSRDHGAYGNRSRSMCIGMTQHKGDELQDEDRSVFRSLCPYCDEPYPQTPSATLKELHRMLDTISTFNPLGGISDNPNPFHCKVVPHHKIGKHCKCHQLELQAPGHADKLNWPDINFSILPHCLVNNYIVLRLITLDPASSPFYSKLMESLAATNSQNIFAIGGKYASFEKTGTR